mmetsp:Transcript_102319/g.294544  ORF Transcript_102319/g.294544 Transcript_102319/m.294544 type:complete len:92 (+) Transcript_102319:2332-2607(+)
MLLQLLLLRLRVLQRRREIPAKHATPHCVAAASAQAAARLTAGEAGKSATGAAEERAATKPVAVAAACVAAVGAAFLSPSRPWTWPDAPEA